MTTVKRHLQIKGYGTALPAHTVTFKAPDSLPRERRRRNMIDLAARAIKAALKTMQGLK